MATCVDCVICIRGKLEKNYALGPTYELGLQPTTASVLAEPDSHPVFYPLLRE
jgi:hypothetical protein